ncbi:sensor histidine kinase [Bacteroides sp.]
MIFSRRIYFIILTHILLISATFGAGLWMILSHTGYIIGGLLIVCSLFQIAGLTRQLNTFNQKIKLFFDAVQDKDNMLYFPEHNVSREQAQLNRALNRINSLLSQVQKENKKQEYFYRSLLEEVPNGVLAWNASGQIIIANSAALALLGCHQLETQSQVRQLLESKENLSLSQSQMKLQGETLTLLSIKDIGDELSDKESESWSKLTHVLTHEIMNTIAPIISLSQTLTASPATQEKAVRGLKIIQAQSERLMEFTESFRHLSYLPHPEKKPFSLTNLLRNLKELLQTDFSERNISFILQCSPLSITIDGDENQLSQVFLNLLKNAMQALEGQSKGEISIIVEQSKRLLIEISDNGPGISTDIQEQIFIPFFTTKPEGTGIGLSLCKQIIRQHEGHLSIKESRPGKTVFSIDLPL